MMLRCGLQSPGLKTCSVNMCVYIYEYMYVYMYMYLSICIYILSPGFRHRESKTDMFCYSKFPHC